MKTVKEKLEDTLMEVDKMIVGFGYTIGGSGLYLKGVRGYVKIIDLYVDETTLELLLSVSEGLVN